MFSAMCRGTYLLKCRSDNAWWFKGLKKFQRVLENAIYQVSVDFSGGDVLMAKRPLDHQQITCATVEACGESVAQAVGCNILFDAGFSKPVFESVNNILNQLILQHIFHIMMEAMLKHYSH
jgi:hypothetical protein